MLRYAPISFTDQVYVGFDHTRTDYALATPDGNELATTNGVDVEYDMRRKEHLAYIATVRYGKGTPFDQSLITGAAGASYLLHYRRYEPYVHAMGGYTRLASQHAAGGMYLSNVNSGFMMLFGAGLDVKVSERWGVRAISLEDLYLPFGSARSTYWSVGSGVLYHFGTGQITMPEDLVSYNPLRVESDARRATGVFTSDSFQMNERYEQHTMPDHKEENAMSTTTGVQPRTFSWLTDGFRDLLSFQKTPPKNRDKAVSVSDATQPILETGPTAALLRMKEKKDTGAPISQKEWARLAQFVQMGAEFSPNRHISRESVVGILQAFRAAYKLRKPGGDEGKAAYYLNKFNTMGQDEDTIEAAVETHLDHAEWPIGNDARPLVVFLRDDDVTDEAALTAALLPYWDTLWRVAARGHFLVHNKPIRDEQKLHAYEPAAATFIRESFVFSVIRCEDHDLTALLTFPGSTAAMYPLAGYPDICEFRVMLAAIGEAPVGTHWKGDRFTAYTVGRELDAPASGLHVQGRGGVTFCFTFDQWNILRALFAEAWENPFLQSSWAVLTEEYGEL